MCKYNYKLKLGKLCINILILMLELWKCGNGWIVILFLDFKVIKVNGKLKIVVIVFESSDWFYEN